MVAWSEPHKVRKLVESTVSILGVPTAENLANQWGKMLVD